ncbi:tetratricopeptide repeat protein, partial [Tessaracoccus sp. SD287]|uniref:tetratricopeptide repeat protein n=1 Tax=Tessaracoccus sp. SD287 TaxID=2782008 RepID=UPI001A95F51E
YVRGDHDQAEQMYQRALAANPTHADNLGNYAIFLTDVRGDHDQAEQMYQRALAANPTHANNLGSYAIFLTDVRGDHDQAEQMYQRALAANPTHANNLGNYARHLFIQSHEGKAEDYAVKALRIATSPLELPLQAECNFYLFAHSAKHRDSSGGELKLLLSRGVTTGNWSFAGNIARVGAENPARAALLTAVASALAGAVDSDLDRFPEWQALPSA